MKCIARYTAVAGLLALAAGVVHAQAAAEPAPGRALSGAITGYLNALPDEPNFGSSIGSINYGSLRFEGRYNYEARASASAFIGWKFSGGSDVEWEVTPIIGTLWGRAHGTVPGVEIAVAYKSFDFYTEAEYVFDHNTSDDNYFYAWSELGWRPVEWLRIGIVGQRTRVIGNDRDLQRGVLMQAFVGKFTLSAYAFNPGSTDRYTTFALGLGF